jgi:hypothetical protein
MNDWDAYLDDMKKAHQSDIGFDDQASDRHIDAILSGEGLPPDADPALHNLAASLSALATVSEQPDQEVPAQIQDAYRDAFDTSNLSKQFDRKRARRRPMLRSLRSAKAAAVAVAAGGLSLGGLTAAYAGVLPDAAQNLAHHAIGAPAAKPHHPTVKPQPAAVTPHQPTVTPHQPTATPVGPDASGRGTYGLCTAWKHAHDSGKSIEAPAFRNLITAAGGADQVDGYCASVFAAKDGQRGKDHMHKPASPTPTAAPQDKKSHAASPGNSSGSNGQGHADQPSSQPTPAPSPATDMPSPTTNAAPNGQQGGKSHLGGEQGPQG